VKKSEELPIKTRALNKSQVIDLILSETHRSPMREKGIGYAPTNIALCKYWGKRDVELNLPITSSLSIALPDKGAMTTLRLNHHPCDIVILNGKELDKESDFVTRLTQFIDLFRAKDKWYLHIDINMNIPVAAGLASSACGFASLVSALNNLFNWKLSLRELSILSRIGSGSAARSLWSGFVEWHAGNRVDGMDSYGVPLNNMDWPTLRVGILSISEQKKSISSRMAMQQTVNSSSLYGHWPHKVAQDLENLKAAIANKNFILFGETAESNALTMHATMLSSWPPICYFLPETIAAMHKIWMLRHQGLQLYFTEDAGPNLKLLFQHTDEKYILEYFPTLEVIQVFE
jgi:diphosphomevalonate decarboxylase